MVHASGWARVGVVLGVVSFAGIAYAHSNGVTGASGKQGSICNSCHNGGNMPKVTLTGPTSLDAGSIATYTFQIETDAAITGMNAAVSDGKLAGNPDGGATVKDFDEVTHARSLRPDGGVAVYTFSMTAPEFGGKITLFAAGNACNNNGQSDGDEGAGTKLDIEVNGPPRPPMAEAGPPTPPPTAPSPAVDAGAGSVTSDAGDEPSTAPAEDSGCAIGWSDRSSVPTGALLGALVGLAAIVRVRRRG